MNSKRPATPTWTKHSNRYRTIPLIRIALSIVLLPWCYILTAKSQLHNLNIRVMLTPDGDAYITETRHMTIDSEGTEVYLVVGNLNGSTVSNLSVTDESGRPYTNIGVWDIHRTRNEKAGKCGIVTKHDGYELCWGLGAEGQRTYITSYVVTNLLRHYTDADGFNYMFVAEGISPQPEHVKLTISRNDGQPFDADSTGMWAFRFYGDISLQDGNIVAETSEPFSTRSAMIVMAKFEHGQFQPSMQADGTFDDMQQQAFEGSDYLDDDNDGDLFFFIFFIFILIALPLIFIAYIIYKWWQRRKVMKDLTWWREAPKGCNLQESNNILNAYRYFTSDYNNLLSACILRLISIGAISIEPQTYKNGNTIHNFVIHPLPDNANQEHMVRMIHNIFRRAAGTDTILEPHELRTWMQRQANQSVVDSFVQNLHTKTSIYQYSGKETHDTVRQLFGLRKYLKEFSLIDERHVSELDLWKDYMIYATLFGIADQVIHDMKKINPEYFNMDKVANQMADDMTLPTIYSTFHTSTSRAWVSKAEREARASGHGGHASFGGGGGFSGGGFGGGVR